MLSMDGEALIVRCARCRVIAILSLEILHVAICEPPLPGTLRMYRPGTVLYRVVLLGGGMTPGYTKPPRSSELCGGFVVSGGCP